METDGEAASETMRAVLVRDPGGAGELEIARVPRPEPGPGEVGIEIEATALNRADLLQRRGLYPPPPGASEVLGLECSGRVTAVGTGVRRLRVGERVMALLPGGGYAEHAVAPEDLVMRVPERLSFEQAAAVPEVFLTASEVLFRVGATREGEWVLIHAAAGGVGSAAVQLARAEGARVIATAGSAEKVEHVRALGADVVVAYRAEDFAERALEVTGGRGVDVVVDFVGRAYADRHVRVLAEAGRWIVVGFLSGARAEIDLEPVLRRRLTIAGFALRSRSAEDKAAIVQRFEDRFRLRLESGRIRPIIDRVYPLEAVAEAHARMENNENLGKIILRVR